MGFSGLALPKTWRGIGNPNISQRISLTEAQGLGYVSLRVFGATVKNLAHSDSGMGDGEISIKLQRMFTLGDALCGAPGEYTDNSEPRMAKRMVGNRRQDFGQLRFGCREGRHEIFHKDKRARPDVRDADPTSASTLPGDPHRH